VIATAFGRGLLLEAGRGSFIVDAVWRGGADMSAAADAGDAAGFPSAVAGIGECLRLPPNVTRPRRWAMRWRAA